MCCKYGILSLFCPCRSLSVFARQCFYWDLFLILIQIVAETPKLEFIALGSDYWNPDRMMCMMAVTRTMEKWNGHSGNVQGPSRKMVIGTTARQYRKGSMDYEWAYLNVPLFPPLLYHNSLHFLQLGGQEVARSNREEGAGGAVQRHYWEHYAGVCAVFVRSSQRPWAEAVLLSAFNFYHCIGCLTRVISNSPHGSAAM